MQHLTATASPFASSNGFADNSLADAPSSHPASFWLFVLLTTVLFLRPAELIPALDGWPIYEVTIIVCLLSSLPPIGRHLMARSLKLQPGAVLVLGMLAAVVLSNLGHGLTYEARMGGLVFLKVVFYYLLLLSLVDSTTRVRKFLLILVALLVAMSIISLLQYHGVIDLPGLAPCEQGEGIDEITGEKIILLRLQGLGIFSDPNDFAIILICGLFIGIHHLIENRESHWRLPWAIVIGILGYTFSLTHSRGGFLALAAGLAAYLVSRRGWRRSVVPLIVVLPVMLIAFGGRQTNIDLNNSDDTAQGRILLWRDAMMEFRTSPLIGIGYEKLAERIGLVAHNSYVHSYTELGFLGGTCFVGAVYCAILGLRRPKPEMEAKTDPELLRWRPCILAMTVGYATGLYSLTRSYALPTYLILGMAAAYANLMIQDVPAAFPQMSVLFLRRICKVSVICLVVIYAFIKVFAR